jgi:prevent-host-death family protein
MITVGAFEAKTHLSSLLEPVARGEEVMITRHGRPIARLVPAGVNDLEATIEEMKRAAKGRRLGISTRRARELGRS